MRRSGKNWMEYDELTKPFLAPDSTESATSVAVELRDRMVRVEQQVLAQYTATAAYATLAQQGVEQARAESRADLDRSQSTIIGLLDRLRSEINTRLDGVDARHHGPSAAMPQDVAARLAAMEDRMNGVLHALEGCVHENMMLRQQIDELVAQQMHHDGWLVANGGPSELSLR
ncbi:MAG: hypothetical protein Q7V88_15165 [Actinomycetota bacterium]|nr:hypothetical protein [Actinomycetota bacterium]